MTDETYEGGCLCKAVRYRFTGAPKGSGLCHCASCRLASGAPAVAWISVARQGFTFVAEKPSRFRSSPPVERTFCGRCGTPLTYVHDDSPDTIDITTATLDQAERFAPVKELWLEHRLSWFPANAGLKHFPRSSTPGKD